MAVQRSAAENLAEPSATLPPNWLAWSIWGVAAIFYLTGFYQRVSPAVMTSELMQSFGISAKDLGNLSAFYFYAYVAMQIPTGVLVDSWGPRKLLILGSLLAAAGTLMFGATDDYTLACVGRAIIGGSTAVGWVVLLKLATHWFPAKRFAMLAGLGLLVGNIGAVAAQVPLRVLIEHFGWRAVVVGSATVILAVCVLAWTVVRNDPSERGFRTYAPESLQARSSPAISTILAGFKRIFTYRNTWLIVAAQGGIVGPMLSFTGLWGTPFLKARFALAPTKAAAVCTVMIVSWAIASPICGALSDKIGKRKPIYLAGCFCSAAGWITMFYAAGLPLTGFIAVAALTSFASGAVVIGFAFAKESVPILFLGTISGAVNIGNMIGPTVLQPVIGRILDQKWAGQLAGGLRVYDVDAFQAAFLPIVGWSLLACVLLTLTTETHCKPAAE
jgi:sugar phosphate permease